MKIAISLIWIRHKVAGGVESFTRNLIDGLTKDQSNNEYYLLCSIDNVESFRHYEQDKRFFVIECPVVTSNLKQTIFFETINLDSMVTQLKADVCFVPTYRMPLLWKHNKYIVVIHDLISCHFPHYFTKFRAWWLTNASRRAVKKADVVVAITHFVREDIIKRFGVNKGKIKTIYNPILPSCEIEDFEAVKKEYGIKENDYFYTVSSFASNKNLMTLLKVMKSFATDQDLSEKKLIISGVGMTGEKYAIARKKVLKYIIDHNLQNRCIFTGFVTNERRNALISNSAVFLFASVFEGFGMPVIEAMELGARVLTTHCSSISEVSKGLANYVNNPYDVEEWIAKIKYTLKTDKLKHHFGEYELDYSIASYLNIFQSLLNGCDR